MALKVKGAAVSADKWNRNASAAAGEMATNAVAAAQTWATETARAADNYGQAITAGNIKQRFLRGVQKAGADKYSRKVQELAQSRFSSGVNAATGDYQNGVDPYLSTLASLSLSPRRPRGDPSNYQRVQQVGQALNAKRMAMLGSSGG